MPKPKVRWTVVACRLFFQGVREGFSYFFIQGHVPWKNELENPEAGRFPANLRLRGDVETEISIQGIARREMSEIAVDHPVFAVNGSGKATHRVLGTWRQEP